MKPHGLERFPSAALLQPPRGFTLLELMVVIAIIGLLVILALPALNAGRTVSKKTVTESTINVLSTGLEMFHSDSVFGGDYPPSTANAWWAVESPYVPGGTQLEGEARIEVYGANLLVWGLVGADLLGTPGFRDLDNSGTGSNPSDPFGGWMNDTSATFDAAVLGKSGSYALYPANYPDTALRGKPVHTRAAPYVDLSKVRLTKRVGNSGLFEVPAGHSKCKAMCFLDAFDQPLLYYRANPGAPCMAADSRSSDDVVYVTRNGRYAPTGVYDLLDNCVYTGTNAAPGYCSNFGAGNNHPIHRLGNPALKPQDPQFAVQNPRGCFVSCLRDPNVTAATAPHKPDSFVLLSAGADSLYGTADDVANFPVNP